MIETVISCRIENAIRNPCYDFLHYLYRRRGWNRTMFGMAKEVHLDSYTTLIQDDIETAQQIRILITQTGEILITCYSIADLLKSMEFISTSFTYGKINYLHFDEETITSCTFTTTMDLPNDFYCKQQNFLGHNSEITLFQNVATIKYTDIEEGQKLVEVVRDVLLNDEYDFHTEFQTELQTEFQTDDEEKRYNICKYLPEIVVGTSFIITFGIRILEFI